LPRKAIRLMNNEVLDQEKQKLGSVVSKIKSAKNELDKKLGDVGKENLSRLKDLRENPETSGMDFFLFLEQIHQKNTAFNLKDKFKRIEELDYLENEPYFARIDLEDDGEEQKIYIGKFGYTENVPVVTDWRAKIASVYYRYRYPQKNVKYDTPDGTVTTDLNLKRTFEIDNGQLIKYYNNDIQLDESEIIVEKIESRTGGVLEDIIESIQASQLDIIEEDPRKLCLVQGCVGSGKSTVAIHKLSHIFFNYPDFIRPNRSILIAKSHVLVGYLSTLFPKLGIFDINYKTIKELVINIIFREELGIKTSFENEDIDENSEDIVRKLDEEIIKSHKKYEEKIKKIFENEEFETFGGYKYSNDITPYENTTEIIEDLEKELKDHRDYIKEKPKSVNAVFFKQNIKTLKKIVTRLKKIRIDIKSDVQKMEKDNLSYQDALAYLYFHINIIGLKKFKKYEYCVIDEGQDISILEYSVIQELVLYNRMCILGDLNQGFVKEGVSKWENLAKFINDGRDYSLYELDTNYRSTKQIIDFANTLLRPFVKDYLPKSIERIGKEPRVVSFENDYDLLEHLKNQIENDSKTLEKSIGIISFDEDNHEKVKELLKTIKVEDRKIIELREDKNVVYLPKALYFTKFKNCKGLEFSKVYVLGLDPNKISDQIEAKKAFIAVTRAMNELEVYYRMDR